MAGLARVEASRAVSHREVQEVRSSGKGRQFDIMVFPHVPCKLSFEVIRNKISQMASVTDDQYNSPEFWCKWTKESELINKITILHLTIPEDATSFKFVIHTAKACNAACVIFDKFPSQAIEVFEEKGSLGGFKNRFVLHNAAKARSLLPRDVIEQDITIEGRGKAYRDGCAPIPAGERKEN